MKNESIKIYPKGVRIHSPEVCKTELACPFHNPTDHKMKTWHINIRETTLTERLCPHNIGHPDPDSVPYMHEIFCYMYPLEKDEDHEVDNCHWWIHGCDGCCFNNE
jgi:hypothetical protein